MKYLVYTLILLFLVVTSISCSNNAFDVNEQETANFDFSADKIKVIDGRIAFSDYESFYNFSKLDIETQNHQINSLIETNGNKFQKNSLVYSTKNDDDYIITSDLLRSIANDDNMYQIGNLIYLETYDYQFITHEDNAHLLFDTDYLQSKLNTTSKLINSPINNDIALSAITDSDVFVYPIQRTEFAEIEPCNPNIYKVQHNSSKTTDDIVPCETGGGGAGQTSTDIDYSSNGENQKYVYFANGGSFRVLFRAKLAKFSNVYSANAYMKLEENNNILFFDNWRERNAETMTFTGATLSLTFNHKQNTTSRITSYDSFPQSSNTNLPVLISNTADFTIPPYYELESVDFGNVIGTMTRQEGNIHYTITRRVDFKKP